MSDIEVPDTPQPTPRAGNIYDRIGEARVMRAGSERVPTITEVAVNEAEEPLPKPRGSSTRIQVACGDDPVAPFSGFKRLPAISVARFWRSDDFPVGSRGEGILSVSILFVMAIVFGTALIFDATQRETAGPEDGTGGATDVSAVMSDPVTTPVLPRDPMTVPDIASAPPAPMPRPERSSDTEASAALAVALHYPPRAGGAARRDTVSDIEATLAAWSDGAAPLVVSHESTVPVSAGSVRFFHPSDRAPAEAIARELKVAARDFSWFRPLPAPGSIEVWLPNSGTAMQRRTVSPAEPPVAARSGGVVYITDDPD